MTTQSDINTYKEETLDFTEDLKRCRLRVNYGMHYLQGNSEPYFSIISDLYALNKTRWKWNLGGCQHELIARAMPRLEPLTTVHMYGQNTGLPMYYYENGKYHFRNSRQYFEEMCLLPEGFEINQPVEDYLVERSEFLQERFYRIMNEFNIEFIQ